MEIKELIERLKNKGCYGCTYRPACVYDDTAECVIRVEAADTIERLSVELEKVKAERDAALREQEEREKPLTLDELREMDGEPVWVETGEVSLGEQILGSWEIFIGRESAIYYFTRRIRGFFAEHYGKTWLAYRSKPEEDAK